MRIKRFLAPDMRTALRMVREEQGPDAVILSNRPIEGGIEIVAATDYDESLAQQALRAAMPALVSAPHAPAPLPARENIGEATHQKRSPLLAGEGPALAAAPSRPAVPEPRIRGRAVFAIGDAPPNAAQTEASCPARSAGATPTPATPASPAPSKPDTSRFEAMMAALIPANERPSEPAEPELTAAAFLTASSAAATDAHAIDAPSAGNAPPFSPAGRETEEAIPETDESAAMPAAPASGETRSAEAPRLHAVPAGPERDPAILAMREEMATMRRLIERELGQFAVERLRGSPARAAAFDALLGYGCDETLAQAVAAAIDPGLDPAQAQAPMLAELARRLTVARHEPIDDGGVIALVGPTGAGKTTTVAKLAARFAQRHRARDVALVTTDTERAGATEQLHILGRRLGITVCEAGGANALGEALDQLADYPLVLVDTAGHGLRDRALLSQILWLRSSSRLRSLLVLPANTHPYDLGEIVRRYRPAAPEGVVLTKLDETGRLGSALSVLVQHGLSLAYTSAGQQVPADLDAADATRLVSALEKTRLAAVNPLGSPDARPATHPTEDRHAIAR